MIMENKLTLTNFIEKKQFDLNAYLVYLFRKEAVVQCQLNKKVG